MTQDADRLTVFLTLDDLAERWQCKPTVIYQMRARHQGPPALRIGRSLRWRLTDVEDWESAQHDTQVKP